MGKTHNIRMAKQRLKKKLDKAAEQAKQEALRKKYEERTARMGGINYN